MEFLAILLLFRWSESYFLKKTRRKLKKKHEKLPLEIIFFHLFEEQLIFIFWKCFAQWHFPHSFESYSFKWKQHIFYLSRENVKKSTIFKHLQVRPKMGSKNDDFVSHLRAFAKGIFTRVDNFCNFFLIQQEIHFFSLKKLEKISRFLPVFCLQIEKMNNFLVPILVGKRVYQQ